MENTNNNVRIKLWKKVMCTFLSIIVAFGTFVTITFSNIPLSDWIDVREAFAATSLSPVPVFYRYGELVGLYRVNYTDKTKLQYKIGDNGTWTDYSVPFAIPAFKTTKVYARIVNAISKYGIYQILIRLSVYILKVTQILSFHTTALISDIQE